MGGGMDSGLMANILNTLGVKVNAYTALPHGTRGTEFTYAKINADVNKCDSHFLIDVKPELYAEYFQQLPDYYGCPNGSATNLNIVSLWRETDIGKEKQLLLGQNSDTFTSSVNQQSYTLILNMLPRVIRKYLCPTMKYDDLLENYLSFLVKHSMVLFLKSISYLYLLGIPR